MGVYVWSRFCMGTAEGLTLRVFATIHVKDKSFRRTSSKRLSWTPSDRISHCIQTLRTSYSQLLARSGIFCLLVEVVYWPCGLKFVCPTINLTFLGIIVKVKLPAKFCLHCFEWFCLQISNAKYVFLSCLRHCNRGLIVVIVYYFQIWNKKEHIISSRVINCHMGPVYILSCVYICTGI